MAVNVGETDPLTPVLLLPVVFVPNRSGVASEYSCRKGDPAFDLRDLGDPGLRVEGLRGRGFSV